MRVYRFHERFPLIIRNPWGIINQTKPLTVTIKLSNFVLGIAPDVNKVVDLTIKQQYNTEIKLHNKRFTL